MKGAILGDIIGSRFEFHNHLSKDFKLLVSGESTFTDDSVMSVAVASAILDCEGDYSKVACKAVASTSASQGSDFFNTVRSFEHLLNPKDSLSRSYLSLRTPK